MYLLSIAVWLAYWNMFQTTSAKVVGNIHIQNRKMRSIRWGNEEFHFLIPAQVPARRQGGEVIGRGGVSYARIHTTLQHYKLHISLPPSRVLTYHKALEIHVEHWLISWNDELTHTYMLQRSSIRSRVVLQVKCCGRASVVAKAVDDPAAGMNMGNMGEWMGCGTFRAGTL